MKTLLIITLLALTPIAHASERDAAVARVCSTLGKVHAQRDHQLYAIQVQSIDGQLIVRREQACIELPAGKHTLGLTAMVRGNGFPKRHNAQGGLKEQQLPIEIEARHTYTLAAQIDSRYDESWIPLVQRVEAW